MRAELAGLEVFGTSIAASVSAFAIPELNLALDMGRCTRILAEQDTVLLSHAHSDHSAGLIAWLSAHIVRLRRPVTRIVLPAARRDTLIAALQAWPDLEPVRRRVDLEAAVLGVEPGDRLELDSVWAEALPARHGVPAVGWRIGRSESCELVYTGDTTVEPYVESPELLKSRVLMVDCSGVAKGRRAVARLSGHSHVQDWIELAPRLECELLVLVHLPFELDRELLESAAAELPMPVLAWSTR